MHPDTFILTFQTWDHYWETEEFSTIDECLRWVEKQQGYDKPDTPQYIAKMSRGRKSQGWTKRQIEDMIAVRYNEAHADEIAAEKAARAAAKAKAEQERAALPPYARDFLKTITQITDKQGRTRLKLDDTELPFIVNGARIKVDRKVDEVVAWGVGLPYRFPVNEAVTVILEIPLRAEPVFGASIVIRKENEQ